MPGTGRRIGMPEDLRTQLVRTYRECPICQGTEETGDRTCRCVSNLRFVSYGLDARVPETKLRALVDRGTIEKEVETYDFRTQTFRPQVQNLYADYLIPYIKTQPGNSYLFLGVNGVGKTVALVYLVSHLAATGQTARFVRFGQFYRTYWSDEPEDRYAVELAFKTQYLALDEPGKERPTDGVITVMERLLKDREEAGRPTFIASNHSIESFRDFYGQSIYSLLQEHYIVIGFSPKTDYRLL